MLVGDCANECLPSHVLGEMLSSCQVVNSSSFSATTAELWRETSFYAELWRETSFYADVRSAGTTQTLVASHIIRT